MRYTLRSLLLAFVVVLGRPAVAAPRLVITLPETDFVVGKAIELDISFQLGRGCWTMSPNTTTLTFTVVVFDERGNVVHDVSQIVMYDLPGCNLAVFCDVDEVRTKVFLDGSGPDMYGPYYRLGPGRYRVQAVYDSAGIVIALKDDEDQYCWDKIFRRDLIKHLESNVVEFEVLPSCDAEQREIHPADSGGQTGGENDDSQADGG